MDGDGRQIEWSRFDSNILLISFDNGNINKYNNTKFFFFSQIKSIEIVFVI